MWYCFTRCCYKTVISSFISLLFLLIALLVLLKIFIPYNSILGTIFLFEVIIISLLIFQDLIFILTRSLDCECAINIIFCTSFIFFGIFGLIAIMFSSSHEYFKNVPDEDEMVKYETSLDCKGWKHDKNYKYNCTAYAKCCIDVINDLGSNYFWPSFIISLIALLINITNYFNMYGYYANNCTEECCNKPCCCDGVSYCCCCEDRCQYGEGHEFSCCCKDKCNFRDKTSSPGVNTKTYDINHSYKQDVVKHELISDDQDAINPELITLE